MGTHFDSHTSSNMINETNLQHICGFLDWVGGYGPHDAAAKRVAIIRKQKQGRTSHCNVMGRERREAFLVAALLLIGHLKSANSERRRLANSGFRLGA